MNTDFSLDDYTRQLGGDKSPGTKGAKGTKGTKGTKGAKGTKGTKMTKIRNYLPPPVALIVRREGRPRMGHEYTNDGAIRAFVKHSWTACPAKPNQGR